MTEIPPKPDSRLPTLVDVARLAGVSTATVSRCLNDPHRVTETTRQQVNAAIKTLGYSPNFGARALAAKRTRTIGAIIPTMENAIFARGIQAFQEELREHGLALLVASSQYREELEAEMIRTLIAQGADALLLIGYHRDPAIYAELERRGVPALIAWVYNADEARPAIGFDNRAAMRALADEVLRLGHRRLGMISAEQAANDRARERILGVFDAMAAAGLDQNTLQLIETPYSIDNGRKAMTALMQREPRPTVVLCGNDVLAAGAQLAARDLGLSIPQDVSLTGFDDIELAQVVTPPLATVHVPHREMGRRAAQTLVAMINGQEVSSVKLDTWLCLRETLGEVGAD